MPIIPSDDITGKIEFTDSDFNLLCNELIVKYKLNPTTKKYERILKRNKINDPLCKLSYYDYGKKTYQTTLELPDIYREGDALLCAKRYLQFFSHQHLLIKWNISYENGIEAQRGNVGYLTIPEAPSVDGNGWYKEPCLLLDKLYGQNYISTTWWHIGPNIRSDSGRTVP